MGFENIADKIDLTKFIDYMMVLFFTIVKSPFDIWNGFPAWIRYSIFAVILAVALLFAYITWKYRGIWRYFG